MYEEKLNDTYADSLNMRKNTRIVSEQSFQSKYYIYIHHPFPILLTILSDELL